MSVGPFSTHCGVSLGGPRVRQTAATRENYFRDGVTRVRDRWRRMRSVALVFCST